MKNQAQNADNGGGESLNLKNTHSSMKNEAQDAENADGESLNLKNTHSSIKNEAQIAENGDGESLNLKNAHSGMNNEAQNADGESLNLKNTHSSMKNQAQIAENGEGESLTLKNAHSSMKNQAQNTENAENGEGESLSLQDLRFNANVSISMCSSSSSSNISNNTNKNADSEQSESTSLSYASNSNSFDANELNFRSICLSKPHKGNDVRWDAIQCVNSKDGDLGLGHFMLLKKLGCGDIGSVYLAELRGMGCLFALKVMDKGMLAGRKKLMRAQTEREILGLLDHPFLPTLYSHFETEKVSCLLMEFCSGGDLHMLRQRQPGKHFTEQAARFYASEVLLALEYLHMMGVVYRDLKPENVLVREDGHIMLSDFDLSLRCFVNPTLVQSSTEPSCRISSYCIQPSCIEPACKLPVCVEPACLQPSCFKPRFLIAKTAKVKTERTTSTNSDSLPVLIAEPTSARSMSFVGTHEYLAPEIIRGDGHGSAVDWWTYGIFLYELLCGRTPFKGNGNRETLFNVVGQSLKFPQGCSASFAAKDLIRGLLIKDPQKRLGFKRGATEIKQHPFFESINWALIRGTHPPEIPKPVDLAILDQKFKPSAPSNDKGAAATDSDRSSGPYLDFEFF